jgi:Flp pilus assembly protein TadG
VSRRPSFLRHGSRTRSRGQSLVEFALVFPIFILLLFGLIDVGRLVYLNSTLSQAAREGARAGAVEASYRGSTATGCNTAGGPICPANDTTLLTHIQSAADRMMAPFGSVTNAYMSCVAAAGTPPSGAWTGTSCSSTATGGQLSVRVTASFTPLTPVIGQIVGTRTLQGTATMTIN